MTSGKAITYLLILIGVTGIILSVVWMCPKSQKKELVIWGIPGGEYLVGTDAAVREYERRNPGIKVTVLNMGAGSANPQKLMTSIVGGIPPDIVRQDRSSLGDWASRDAFLPLDDLMIHDQGRPDGIEEVDFYRAAWAECKYGGRLYAVPCNADNRVLFYNRKLFRRAGLDPNKPPRTWSELAEYARKLTLKDSTGRIKQIGFIPLYGNGLLNNYAFANDGQYMTDDGLTCTLNSPQVVESLQFVKHLYEVVGGVKAINVFSGGFSNAGTEMDPFILGKVAMKIDGNWVINGLVRYAPDMDFGVASLPIPDAAMRDKPASERAMPRMTWSGGFAYVIPRGAKNVEESWKLIRWLISEEGTRLYHGARRDYYADKGRTYIPDFTANRVIDEKMFKEFGPTAGKAAEAFKVCADLMPYAKWRVPTKFGQIQWDSLLVALDKVTLGKKTPGVALEDATKLVRAELLRSKADADRRPMNLKSLVMVLSVVAICLVIGVVLKIRSMRIKRGSLNEILSGLVFVSPWAFGFVVFTIGPVLASFVLSFSRYDVLHAPAWVGLGNYVDLFSTDKHLVFQAICNAGFFAVFGIPLNMATGLAIAMLLNTNVKGMSWYRTIYYLPSVVPVVANLILWIWLLNPDYGLINAAWKATVGHWFGWPPLQWLADERTAKPALILMGLWGAGGGMLLWLAGLKGVPRQLYEAAEVDGAGAWGKFYNVTLPMITPYLFFNLIMGIIGVLQVFEASYIMTGGGPDGATMVPMLYLFNNAFMYFKMGYASALAWILFAIILALTLLQFRLSRHWVYYESGARG